MQKKIFLILYIILGFTTINANPKKLYFLTNALNRTTLEIPIYDIEIATDPYRYSNEFTPPLDIINSLSNFHSVQDQIILPRKGSLWIKLSFENQTAANNFILSLGSQIEYAAFFDPQSQEIQITGDQFAYGKRNIFSLNPAFSFFVEQEKQKTIYLNIWDFQSKVLNLNISKGKVFSKTEFSHLVIVTTMLSFLFVTGIISFFIGLRLHKKVFISFSGLNLFLTLFYLGKFRLWAALFTPNIPYTYFIYNFSTLGTLLFASLFITHLFNFTDNQFLKITFYSNQLILIIALVFSIIYPSEVLGLISQILTIITLLIIFSFLVFNCLHKERNSFLFFLALTPSITMNILENLDILYLNWASKSIINLGGTTILTLGLIIILGDHLFHVDRTIKKIKNNFDNNLERRVYEKTNELHLINQELSKKAETDGLTKTLNRIAYLKDLKTLSNQQANLNNYGVAYLDLDNFKKVNDTLGHSAGDTLLIEVSKLLGNNIKKSDRLYRIGGDEFLIFFFDITLPTLEKRTIEILKEVEQIKIKELKGIHIGITAGIYYSQRPHKLDFSNSVKKADSALIKLKQHNKGAYSIITE